jgi:hypothetical protein
MDKKTDSSLDQNTESLKEIVKEVLDLACNLRLKKKVITYEEYEKLTNKLYDKVEKLKKEIDILP